MNCSSIMIIVDKLWEMKTVRKETFCRAKTDETTIHKIFYVLTGSRF